MADGATALGEAVYAPEFVSAPAIIACVAATLAVSIEDITAKLNPPNVVAARQICTLLFAEFTLLSQVEMGRALGRSDHTAGRHTLIKARERLVKSKVFAAAFQQARKRVLQGNHGV